MQLLTFSSDLRLVVSASTDDVVQYWFSQIRAIPMAGGPIPGRTFSRHWQTAVDCPSYTLGAWLGRTGTHHDGDWTVLCAGVSGSQITTSFQELRYVAPRQGSPSEAPPDPPHLVDYDDHYFYEKMHLA